MKKGVKKHWRESITVEIEWPWITPHCTLAYSKRQITLYTDGVWLEGDRWVCEFSWPCENDRILISGYFDIYAVGGDCTTQHVRAARTFDGLRETEEKYKIRVLAAA